MDLDNNITSCTETKDDQGRRATWTEETRDVDGVLISRRVDSYAYYATGEIDTIVQEDYDKDALTDKREVKHFVDGKQPTVEIL